MGNTDINDMNDHTVCGDAKVLVPDQTRREFGKRRNLRAPQLALDIEAFKKNFRTMKAALPEVNWQYAMKTNDDPGLLTVIMHEGNGFDCSSIGEIQRVHGVATALGLNAADVMNRCSLGNPNKMTRDIADAYKLGVRVFSVDDENEINKVAAVAPGARVYLRTYVDITQKTAISVFTNKFGAPASNIALLAEKAKREGLIPFSVGLSVGGGQTDPDAFALGVEIAANINANCQKIGVTTMDGITFCGGLPAPSAPGAPSFKTIGDRIRAACHTHGIATKDVTFEPGRSLGTTCGIIEATVINLKKPLEAGDPWTLVLNIGPFKGLFEMERTNLTYKMSAYLTHGGAEGISGEKMVDARIVDDTCDSKGTCFRGKTVLVPPTLTEGSRVYFHNTGSYTTAYVMEGFNRTPALTTFCFPDPLASARIQLPRWLQGVQTPGEAAHPNVDFPSLWEKRQTLTDPEAIRQSVRTTPGSGRLGVRLLPAADRTNWRELNTRRIVSKPDHPGSELRIGYQPQHLFKTLEHGWIANSDWLTFNRCKDYRAAVSGGADAWFCLQNQYRSSVPHCTLMHGTLVIIPKDGADGGSHFLEVNYDPTQLDGLDQGVIDQAFRDALRYQMPRRPQGAFEQLLAGTELVPRLANSDLVWAGELGIRPTLAEYWPRATLKPDGTMRPINLEGALRFEWTPQQFASALRSLAIIKGSYDAGYAVTNGAHDDPNSCLGTIILFIMKVMMNGEDRQLGDGWPTDRKIEHLAKLANECRWAEKSDHTILDIDKFKNDSLAISPDQFTANFQSILSHPTMMTPHGENAYNTIYMHNPDTPHTAYEAQELYRADAALALQHHPSAKED